MSAAVAALRPGMALLNRAAAIGVRGMTVLVSSIPRTLGPHLVTSARAASANASVVVLLSNFVTQKRLRG